MTNHAEPQTEETFDEYVARENAEAATEQSPAPDPVAPVAAAPEPVAQPASNEPFEGFNLLPADTQKALREKLDAAEANRKTLDQIKADKVAVENRLVPTQRELVQARKRLADFEKAQRDTSRQPIDKMRDIDPDSYAALTAAEQQWAERFQHTEQELAQMREVVGQFQAANYSQGQMTEVRKLHPDISEVAASPEFNAWCASLGQKGQARLLAPDAETVAEVISDFKTAYRLAELELEREQRDSQQQATPAAPASPRRAHAVDPNPSVRRSSVGSAKGKGYTSDAERDFDEWLAANPNG